MTKRFAFLLLTIVSLRVFAQTGTFIPSDRFSSGLINDICQDKYGFIWIATDNGLNKYDGYRFTSYFHHPADTTTVSSNIVVKLYCDKAGRLWVGTRAGLSLYDYATDNFRHYLFPEQNQPRTISIMERSNGEFLVGTSGRGLYVLRNDSLEKVPDGYTTPTGNWYFSHMMEDSHGRFWKCGYGQEVTMKDAYGVHQMMVEQDIVAGMAEIDQEVLLVCLHGIYSYRDGVFGKSDIDLSAVRGDNVVMGCTYLDAEKNLYIGTRGDGLYRLARGSRKLVRVECNLRDIDLNTAKLRTIKGDAAGNIWLGCESKGLVMLPRTQPHFAMWSLSAQGYNVSSIITSVCEDDDNMVWCTVQGNGVFGFNKSGRVVAHPAAPSPAEVIYRDRKGRYWIGTDHCLYAYNPQTGQSHLMETLECDHINDITEDKYGNLFISTFGRGFQLYNPETKLSRHFSALDEDSGRGRLWNNWILGMMPDRWGNVWFATSDGVSCYDASTDSFRPYRWEKMLENKMCYSLCEMKNGIIMIGTDQGIFQYQPDKAKCVAFSIDGGLADKTVGYMVQSANGDLWCATSLGLWQYDVRRKKFIGYISGNGLATKEYIYCVGMHNDSDVVCFANNDGLTVFRPAEVGGTRQQLPAVLLTNFMIAGHPVNTVTESNGDQVTTGPIVTSDEFHVSYLDNSITMEFSLLDFADPQNVIFEYCINDADWLQNEAGENAIQLSHLQPGTYQIKVRALSSGVYSGVKLITVSITPPWYQSTWAYLLYSLGLLALLVGMTWALRRRANRRMDEEKMKFLINATHDIRSPLTLIMGPLSKLKSTVTDDVGKSYIDTIDRNCQKLMMLVNQILDQRRIDKHQMQLHCQETNVVDLVSRACRLYQMEAQQRNITFTFEHAQNNVPLWVDRMNFDKVISNLLSNAFKYTCDGGEIKTVLVATEKEVVLKVIDSGVGFPKEESTKHLFDRFHQGSNNVNLLAQGTGIGLNLCRTIVEMHGGRIKAENRSDGVRGACMTVVLLTGNKHLKPEQIVENENQSEVLSTSTSSRPQKNIRVMLVDDDPDIPDYIRFELGSLYKFTICHNGREALQHLLSDEIHFDIVVSDVMMPEMDGIELLRRIKENPHTSDLPVILLTSKTEVSYRLEGIKKGADAYLSKPFDMEELHVQIENLVGNVRRLRGVFSGASTQRDKVENVELKSNDEQLMERIMKAVNANISDPDYNVEDLARDVGLSRAQLHRKMKEITGLAAGKFVRNLRMEQAGRLIREGGSNISQVAYSIGFNDQAHFATVFKTYYGMTPSEYAVKNKGQ